MNSKETLKFRNEKRKNETNGFYLNIAEHLRQITIQIVV